MDDAIGNILSNPCDSDPLDASRSKYVHLSAQQALKIFCKPDKLEAYRTFKLHEDINIACFVGLPPDIGPKQAHPLDAELGDK
jgi:hypothetical protein